ARVASARKRQRPSRGARYRRRNCRARSGSGDPPCGAGQRQFRSLRTWLTLLTAHVYALVLYAAADVTFEPRHCELSEAPVADKGSFQRACRARGRIEAAHCMWLTVQISLTTKIDWGFDFKSSSAQGIRLTCPPIYSMYDFTSASHSVSE